MTKVDEIIKEHVIYSTTAAAIPIPLADIAAITVIQIDMIKQLAGYYNVSYDKDAGKSIVSSLAGSTLARMGASVIKGLPVVGTALGIGSQMILSGSATYALGKIFSAHFANNGVFRDLNASSLKDAYEDFYKKGKEIVKGMRQEAESEEDILTTIEKLSHLRDQGAITEDDFEITKKKLLEKLSS